jgi:hypothetical protein
MIDDFDQGRLERRRVFLESRANFHLTRETDRRWHVAAAATLLRDAAAVALISNDISGGRTLLRTSGDLLLGLGLVGGLQLLYLAGTLDFEEGYSQERIDQFQRAYNYRTGHPEVQSISPDSLPSFDDESFRPPQLLRVYQALAGRRGNDEKWFALRNAIRDTLALNATMPVGPARTTLAIYLAAFDQLANRDSPSIQTLPRGVSQVLSSLAQRREELLIAARRDRFHWKALLRPAELVDFDLLALLIAGVRRGQASAMIETAFEGRDAMTALPQALATALS